MPPILDHAEEHSQARDELVKQAGHKRQHSVVRTMFEEGQLSGTRFTLERVAHNEVLVSHLTESLQRLRRLPAELECAVADSDVSDDGE